MSEDKNDKENLAFLQYLRETEKFPVEMEALRTTIESNKSTVALAEESINHFGESRKNNNVALIVSVSLSIITLIILTVQTFSTSKTELKEPLELNKDQLKEVIDTYKNNPQILKETTDSLRSRVKTLENRLNLQINNSRENEKSDRKAN